MSSGEENEDGVQARKLGLRLFMDLPYFTCGDDSEGAADDAASDTFKLRSSLTPVSFKCDEGINQCYRIEIVASMSGDYSGKSEDFLGEAVALRVEWYDSTAVTNGNAFSIAGGAEPFPNGRARNYSGRVAECQHIGDSFDRIGGRAVRSFYRFTVRPSLWFMAQKYRSRTWLKTKVKDILDDILGGYGKEDEQTQAITPGEWELSIDLDDVKDPEDADKQPLFKERPIVFQYEERDLDFLTRWMERQGWYYYFTFKEVQPDDNGLMKDYEDETLKVTSENYLQKCGGGDDDLFRPAMLADSQLGYQVLGVQNRKAPAQVVIHDYNPDTPSKKLEGKWPATPEESGLPPVLLDDEFFDDNDEGKALAKVRMEGYDCRKTIRTGRSNLPGVCPGFSLLPFGQGVESGQWVDKGIMVVSATHSCVVGANDILNFLKDAGEGTDDIGYRNSFDAVLFNLPYHHEISLTTPAIAKPVVGWILPVDDKTTVAGDGKYYVRAMGVEQVQAEAFKNGSLGPIRGIVSSAGLMSGSVFTLQPGTEVMLGFTEGNPDRPFIMGPVRNADNKVTYTNNLNEFKFTDGKTIQEMKDSLTLKVNSASEFILNARQTTVQNTITSINASLYNAVKSRFGSTSGIFKSSLSSNSDQMDVQSWMDRLSALVLKTAPGVIDLTPLGDDGIYKQVESYQEKLQTLVSYIGVILQVKEMNNADARMTLKVKPGDVGVNQVSTLTSTSDTVWTILDYCLEVVNNALKIADHATKINDATKEYKENYPKDNWIKNYTYYASLVLDVTSVAVDIAMFGVATHYAKKANTALAEKGIKLSVFKTDKVVDKAIKLKKKGTFTAAALPPLITSQMNSNGYNIDIQADGPLLQESGKHVSITASPANMVDHALGPLNQVQPDAKASIMVTAGTISGTQATVNGSSVAIDAKDINMTAVTGINASVGDHVTLKVNDSAAQVGGGGGGGGGGAPTAASLNAKSILTMSQDGDSQYLGEGNSTINFTQSIKMNANASLLMTGDQVVIGAVDRGVVIGSLNANRDDIKADYPQISVNGSEASYSQLMSAKDSLDTKIRDRTGLEDQKAVLIHQKAMKLVDRDGLQKKADKTEADLAKITTIDTEVMALDGQIAAKDGEITVKKGEVATAQTAFTNAYIATRAGLQVLLANGSNKAQQVCVTQKEINVQTDNKVTIKDSGSATTLVIDVKGKKIQASASKFVVDKGTVSLG